MSIEIKQQNRKWRLRILEEEWEFETKEEFEETLLNLVGYKDKFGDIKK